MMNWFSIVTITLAVAIGTEIGRRRQEAKGEIFCFQPIWHYRVVGLLLAVSVLLFIEAAKNALHAPTSSNIWLLIIAAGAAQVFQVIMATNEFLHAKRRIKALDDARTAQTQES